jgi:hypothetical protein
VRYKWRRRRSLVRFVVLALDGIWRGWIPPEKRTERPKSTKGGKTQGKDRQRSQRAA